MYWLKTINFLINKNNKLGKKIINNLSDFNKNKKIEDKKKNEEFEENLKFIENIENVKKKFKIKEEDLNNNWDPYKTKYDFIKKPKKFKLNKTINIIEKNIKKIINNLNYKNQNHQIIMNINTTFNYNNINFNNIFKKINKINENRINSIVNKSNWKILKPLFAIIDIRSLKTRIIFFTKNNCISTMTNGLVFKKMQLNNKKYKKSEKLSYLSVKLIVLRLKNYINNRYVIIQIKGLKKYSKNIIKYFNQISQKNLKDNNKSKFIYINNNKTPNNFDFKFKKIKSIKRRLKKKMVKIK